MAFITEKELRNKVIIAKSKANNKQSNQILNESVLKFSVLKTYDIFLSHSFLDADLILGVKEYLETEFNLSVYVDWIEDKQLNRASVNKETASILRIRMSKCKSLVYLVSDNSNNSKWMPWELGYFDGLKNGKVVVMPVMQNSNDQFIGAEYLQLYKYIDKPSKISIYEKDKLEIGGLEIRNWIG